LEIERTLKRRERADLLATTALAFRGKPEKIKAQLRKDGGGESE
jgi:hypothetical protein